LGLHELKLKLVKEWIEFYLGEVSPVSLFLVSSHALRSDASFLPFFSSFRETARWLA